MKRASVLWIGCGDLGIRAGEQLCDSGWRFIAVRRDVTALPPAFESIAADYTQPGSLSFAGELRPEFVVTTFNPADRSQAGYRAGFTGAMANLLQGLDGHRPRHIFMVSSTRVYAERDGGWVEEDSPTTTADPWAAAIIEAEDLLLQSGHSASILRFAGIYGIPGGRLLSRVARGEICPRDPVSYTNRIHREDGAGFIVHLLALSQSGEPLLPVYIGADDAPAARYEVESWLARKLGVVPGESSAEPMRHNRAGHKRCRNLALHASGYRLRYPDYRSGYAVLLEARA